MYWKVFYRWIRLTAVVVLIDSKCLAQADHANWRPLGPTKVAGYYPSIGRVNCIGGPAKSLSTLYLGTPGGGVWRSSDDGSNWAPISDFLPVLGISSLTIYPTDSAVIYIATGDADGRTSPSVGVFKSIDGGGTWTPTGLYWPVNPPTFHFIYKLAGHPSNPQWLFAATNDGIYTTHDGGGTWQRSTPGGITHWDDLTFQPGSDGVMYTVGNGPSFFRSADAGTNWTQITNGLPADGAGRCLLAVSRSNPAGVYLLCARASDSGYFGLYRSTDAGSNFTLISSNTGSFQFGKQAYFSMAVAVSPVNFDEVYIGGFSIGKSTNGGVTWQDVRVGSQSGALHPDVHGLTFLNGALYALTDGGVSRTFDAAANWEDLSETLQIAQIFKVGNATQNPSLLYAGEQDNGLVRYDGTWQSVIGGDVTISLIDPTDQNVVYAVDNGVLYKSINSGSTFAYRPIAGGSQAIGSLAASPVDHLTLFAGMSEVWKTTDGGETWFPISNFPGIGSCTALALAPSNPDYIYAIRNGAVWRTSNGGITWNDVSQGIPGFANAVAISPRDPNKVWVAQNESIASNQIYSSMNGGATWRSDSAGLPDRMINCLVYQNGTDDGLYAGFESGVYYRNASLSSWQPFLSGLPNASVRDLQINDAAQKLRAGTFGRGFWETDVTRFTDLAFRVNGRELVLSWEDPSFVLEQAATLSSGSWTPISTNSPAVVSMNSTGNRFFRLRR